MAALVMTDDSVKAERLELISRVLLWAAGDTVGRVEPPKVTIDLSGDRADVTFVQMYEHVAIGMRALEAVAKVLGTDQINFGHRSYERGCSSCDFGSKATVELRIMGIRFPIPWDFNMCRWCSNDLAPEEVITGENKHRCMNWNGEVWPPGERQPDEDDGRVLPAEADQ